MSRATEVLALPIVDIRKGSHKGVAKNILLNPETGELHLTLEKEHPGEVELLGVTDITGVGENYLLIPSQEVLKGLYTHEEVLSILKSSFVLLGVEVVDQVGNQLGEISDFTLGEGRGIGSIFLDSGQEIEGGHILSVCPDIVFVDIREGSKEVEIIQKDTQNTKIEKQEEQSLPIGLVLKEDIRSADGEFQLKKGSVITEEVMEEAEAHDALLLLALHAE